MAKDPRTTNDRYDKRPNLARAADPTKQDFGTAARTAYAKEAPQGPAYGYDQSKPGQDTFGKSSSYSVSSGLVNMLDVTKGVTQITGQVNQAMDVMDKNRASNLQLELEKRQREEDWLELSPEAQYDEMKRIQKPYENGWYTNAGRNNFMKSQSSLDFAAKKNDLESGLSITAMEEQAAIAKGQEDDYAIWQRSEERYKALLAEHGQDPVTAQRIRDAMQASRATSEAARSKVIDVTLGRLAADEAFQAELRLLDPALGYEEWRKIVMEMAIESNPEALRGALGPEYDEETDTFSGPYSDGMTKRIDAMLEGKYQEKIQMQLAKDRGNAGIDAQTLRGDAGSSWTVNALHGDDATAAKGRAELIGNLTDAMTLHAQTTTDTTKRKAWWLSGLTEIVEQQNANDASGNQAGLQAAWQDVVANEEFQRSMFGYLGIADDDEEGKAAALKQAEVHIGLGFKVHKDRKVDGARESNQTNGSPWLVAANETDTKAFADAAKDSVFERSRHKGFVNIQSTPIDEENYGSWAAGWMTFAVEAAFARVATDEDFSTEDALKFKESLPDYFVGVTSEEEAREAAESLAIALKADIFHEDFPYALTPSADQAGDWTIHSKTKSDDTSRVAQASAMAHMQVTKAANGRYVMDLKNLRTGVYQHFFTTFSDRYDQALGEQDGIDTVAVTEMIKDDFNFVNDVFGDLGIDIFTGMVLSPIINSNALPVTGSLKEAVVNGISGIISIAKDGVLTEDQLVQIGEQLSMLNAKGRRVSLQGDRATAENPLNTQTNLVIKSNDEVDPAMAIGSGLAGVDPQTGQRHLDHEMNWFERAGDMIWGFFSGALPGDDQASAIIQRGVFSDQRSMVLLTDAMYEYTHRKPNSKLVQRDGHTVEINADYFDKGGGLEAAKEFTAVLEAAGIETVPQYDKDGVLVGAVLQRTETDLMIKDGKVKDSLTSRNYNGPFHEIMARDGVKRDDNSYLKLQDNLAALGGGVLDARTEATLAHPDTRRGLREWGTSHTHAIASKEGRKDLNDRIEAQLAVITNIGRGREESEGWEDLRTFQAELQAGRGGPMTTQYHRRAVELAETMGVSPNAKGEVGKYFLMAAIAEDAMDVSQWPHAPTHLRPESVRHIETVGGAHNLRAVKYSFGTEFQVSGSPIRGSIELPLFAPSRLPATAPFDPSFFATQRRDAYGFDNSEAVIGM